MASTLYGIMIIAHQRPIPRAEGRLLLRTRAAISAVKAATDELVQLAQLEPFPYRARLGSVRRVTSPNAEATTAETFDTAPPADPDSATTSQSAITAEILQIEARYRASGVTELQPRLDYPPYRSTILRHPTKDPRHVDPETIELWSPCFGHRDVHAIEADLTIQHGGEPIGERIIVTGRVLDGDGRPVRGQLVEIWQANAGGRYLHKRDQHPSPIDPNFTGVGRCLTSDDGSYRFTTIKPGPYPWKNHRNAWRPAHIHFSLFGTEFTQRMITQMYFPGDPLFPLDPILQTVVDADARDRLVASYDHDVSQHEWNTGYRWDIVLTGRRRTPLDEEDAA
jgi:protocatechuate 3,4-dioxygenase beta subunit